MWSSAFKGRDAPSGFFGPLTFPDDPSVLRDVFHPEEIEGSQWYLPSKEFLNLCDSLLQDHSLLHLLLEAARAPQSMLQSGA